MLLSRRPATLPGARPSGRRTVAPAIEVRGLRRTFADGVVALAGIDLTVHAGEMFGYLGPNGAGKTTTVRTLCTLLAPSDGQVRVAGIDVRGKPAAVRRAIGVALQDIGLDPLQTGRELLRLQCGLYGITGRAGRARARELLALVGLEDAADRRTAGYSGGMKRRLDLASALVHAPRVLFLDEPTNGLDPASRQMIWEEVRRINRAGTTVFLTTQYLEEADRLCDRVAIVDRGRIAMQGTPADLKARFAQDVIRVEVGPADLHAARAVLAGLPALARIVAERDVLDLHVADGPRHLAEVVRRLDRHGIAVVGIAVRKPTLDDVFLESTGRRLEGAEVGRP